MTDPYPLLLERRLSRRLWGGSQLAGYLGIQGDGEAVEPLAESWQVYGENRILNGVHARMTLEELAAQQGAALLGTATVARYGRRVPLLAKFIDAGEPLSIQVHPDDEYALAREAESGHLGKAEAWYVLACSTGAHVVWGFNRDLTAQEVREAVAQGSLEQLVNRIPVRPGDVIYNPEGVVHAIGGGIFLFEIQQSSDLTYRLYDYGRRDASGRERELHLDKALEVALLSAGRLAKVAPLELGKGRRLLLESDHFAMEGIEPDGKLDLVTSPASLELLTVTRGRVGLHHASGALELGAGTSAVLPAGLGAYWLEGSGEVLRCYLPIR